jgi:Fe-S-cluster containining protein
MHKCKKCGLCCVDIPVTEKELSMFKFILKDKFKNEIEEYNRHGLKYKIIGICPFLKNKRCEIYNFKPHICDIYPINDKCVAIWKDNLKGV